MTENTSRNIILNILLQVLDKGVFLEEALSGPDYSPFRDGEREKRFTETTCYGVVETLPALSEIIGKVSSVPLKKMRPVIRTILLFSAYQILYMRTEDYAVVSEAVRLTEKRGFFKLKGFVNGILRRVSSDRKQLLESLSEQAASGLPEELYVKFMEWYGRETALRIFEGFRKKEKDSVVVRRCFCYSGNFEEELKKAYPKAEQDEFFRDIYRIPGMKDPSGDPLFQKGGFYIQSYGSILATNIASDLFLEREDLRVLDVCASPGGKSLNAADKMKGRGQVLSCDVSERKMIPLRENIERFQLKNMTCLVADAAEYREEFREKFDLVIADLPCSGLGTLSEKPDIRLHVTEQGLKDIVGIQRKILSNVKNYVRPGGSLLYSTCTLNPEENEENLRWFLSENRNFSPVDLSGCLPDKLKKSSTQDGYLLILPGEVSDEGFFMSRITRRKE